MGCTANKRLHHQLPQVQTGLTPVTKPMHSSSASSSNLDWYTNSMRYENHSKTEILSVLTRKIILQNAYQFSSVQSLSPVGFFPTPLIATCQASLSITNSRSLRKLMSIELVMPSNHLILCRPFLLLPSIFPSIRVFSNESALRIRWPKYWSFSFSISPFNEYSGLISFRMAGLISMQSKGLSRVFSNTTIQKHQFFRARLSL